MQPEYSPIPMSFPVLEKKKKKNPKANVIIL